MSGFFWMYTILPCSALLALAIDNKELLLSALIQLLFVQICMIVCIKYDKVASERKWWRVSENILHTLEILGSWPVSYYIQRQVRHKTAKKSYQLVFNSIVAVYQIASLLILVNQLLL